MRVPIAQLIVDVTVAAFLIAFGGFLLGTLERLFLPISVIGFLGFLIWSQMFSGKNVWFAFAISLPAILVWIYMLLTYDRLLILGSIDSMANLNPMYPQPFPHPDAVLKFFLEDRRLSSETNPADLASVAFRVISMTGLSAICLAGWFLGSLIRRKPAGESLELAEAEK